MMTRRGEPPAITHTCSRGQVARFGDYFALISGLRLVGRSGAEGAGRKRGSSLAVLGRCRGEIAHKSLTTRTLLQKHGPGAAGLCHCRGLIYRANVDNARNILACSLRKSRFFGSLYTGAPVEEVPAKYHGGPPPRRPGKCTYARAGGSER